ncbi:MAG: hypothetical protein LBD80_03445 [Tannerella sp.]|jgi:hypothetical protein|nr:hypothetical protein [Tannerella sp.]
MPLSINGNGQKSRDFTSSPMEANMLCMLLLGGKYYLYEVSSKWDPEKKRSVKIIGKLLGKISESEGFVESEKAQLRKQRLKVEQIQVT